MKIIILGAGELGKHLAGTLTDDEHDITVIDISQVVLERLKDRCDVMTVCGNGASVKILKQAEAGDADLLIAASDDDAVNILACQLARHLGVKKTICRLYGKEYFSEDDGLLPDTLGIASIVVPADECVIKILDVLRNKIVLNKVRFSNKDALMTGFEVFPSSPLAGIRIKDFSDRPLLESVRFSAILRDRELLIPHGDTIIVPGDKIYVAGPRDRVNAMVDWCSPDDKVISHVIIAGATRLGRNLAKELCKSKKYEVRVIEKDPEIGKRLLDETEANLMVINGDPAEKEVMQEAGVDRCDAFISALKDDEQNILSCILAKGEGAGKVITVTNKSEYTSIVPAMHMIDCGFSSSLVAVNSVLRNMGTGIGAVSVDAILHRINAFVFELIVTAESEVCNKKILDCNFPLSAVLALVFRDGNVLAANGTLELLPNDIVVTIATKDTVKLIEPMFTRKRFFSL